MARKPAPGTRDKILDTAARLFYEQGVHAVGVQQIIEECDCGKNLLYREFTSKDDLVVAYLERCSQEWDLSVDKVAGSLAGNPAEQLIAMVRFAAERSSAPDFRGCPFQNTHAEFPDPNHPAHKAAEAHLATVRAKLRSLAEEAGAAAPETLADRLLLIIDGVYANSALLGDRAHAETAVSFAEEVVRAAVASPMSAESASAPR
jgi:AcrR family transcriptional regulator